MAICIVCRSHLFKQHIMKKKPEKYKRLPVWIPVLDTHSMKGQMKNHSTLLETGEFIIKRLDMMVMKLLLKGNYIRCMSYAIAAGAFQPC